MAAQERPQGALEMGRLTKHSSTGQAFAECLPHARQGGHWEYSCGLKRDSFHPCEPYSLWGELREPAKLTGEIAKNRQRGKEMMMARRN